MRTSTALAPFLTVLCAVPAASQVVGSPVINRPIDDSSSGLVCFYRGGSQPISGPNTVSTWSFFDDDGTAGQTITPLLFEVTGATQWTVVAVGTPRITTGGGAQSHSFEVKAGSGVLQAGKQYTIGFAHRDYTFNAGVATPGQPSGGIVDFTGYNDYTDRWSYSFAAATVGTVIGTGGEPFDQFGFDGRIYSAQFTFGAGGPVTYCTAGTSTTGCQANMSFVGAPSVSASSGFTLRCSPVEPNKQGLFFYGVSGQAISPWAPNSTSYLCVKSPTQRMSLLNSNGTAGVCNGTLSLDWLAWLAANPGSLGAPFSAGVVVNAQAWYRDPPAAKTTNLSNALEFVTLP